MVRRFWNHHQPLLGECLPSLHRPEGHKVVLRSENEYGLIEGAQLGLGSKPISNDIDTPPMGAWIPLRVGRH